MKKLILFCFATWLAVGMSFGAKYEHLYIIGNGCDAGWGSPGDGIEMTPDVEGVFIWEGNLYGKDTGDNGNMRFKFLTNRTDWQPGYTCEYIESTHHTLVTLGEEMKIYEYLAGSDIPSGHDFSFQVEETAKYRVKVDLNMETMVVTRLGDADVSENPATVFTAEEFQATNGVLKYRKLVPLSVEEGKTYPLVIFLHGKGERGDNNSSQLAYAGTLFTKAENREAYPAYVLFPQCPSQYFGAFDEEPASFDATTFPEDYPISVANGMVKELIDSYLELDEIDKDRVYIFGLSMGGMATYDLVCRFPEVFAAAVPLCGGVNAARLEDERLAKVYWRIFHGDADGVVPVQNSRTVYEKLQVLGAEVEYIEVPGADHFVWTPAFEREDFLSWMFDKTRMKSSSDVMTAETENTALSVYGREGCLAIRMAGGTDYEVYNLMGQAVTVGALENGEAYLSLAQGVYIVRAYTGNGQACERLTMNY